MCPALIPRNLILDQYLIRMHVVAAQSAIDSELGVTSGWEEKEVHDQVQH